MPQVQLQLKPSHFVTLCGILTALCTQSVDCMTERLGVVRALKAVRSVNDSLNIQLFVLTMYDGLSALFVQLSPHCADHVRWRHLKQSYTCFTELRNGTKRYRKWLRSVCRAKIFNNFFLLVRPYWQAGLALKVFMMANRFILKGRAGDPRARITQVGPGTRKG